MSTLRRASLADFDRVVVTLVRAFDADPLIRFMLPDDAAYREWQGSTYFRLVARPWFDHGEVWVTDDVVAVSVWGAPNPPRRSETLRAELIALFERFDADLRARMSTVAGALKTLKPAEPHWYLQFLGTHPDWQRCGLGSILSSVASERCDRGGIVQFLETSTEDDVAFYSSRGFQVSDTLTITAPDLTARDGGGTQQQASWPTEVTVTTMIRLPK
mgnify:CR=1 FL=1